ncbi:cytochrome P450 [Microvirga vignae]|uniref:Cytochrome P450 n=1 Tax=Microvirga vignae TaxID=1225564 RepID=A0A0H1R7P5_9HYPH|nr:cytochrome P450 [Microvirga vignae]KLK90811.1 cytochrome P450 [Microvirga vignae]
MVTHVSPGSPPHSAPGPKGLPFLGSLPDLGRDILGFFTRCARQYGDIVSFRLAAWPAMLLNHPDLVEYVLVKNHQNFIKHRFFWRHVEAIFGHGLLTSEGKFWHQQRRLAAPAFAGSRLNSYADTMVQFTERMLQQWQSGQVLDVHQEAMGLTLQIAAKTLFDAEASQDVTEVSQAIDEVMEQISVRFRRPFRIPDAIPLPGNLRYRRGVRRTDQLVARIIAERRHKTEDRGDLLSQLMLARDEAGRPMSERQIRDEVITMLLAGHETTALTLSWTWYLLGLHPAVDAQLAEEVHTVLRGRSPTVDDLPRLRLAEQVVSEALRLYPPAYAIGREALADCEIAGYHVPAGTTIYVSPWVMHRDSRWFDDPQAFQPARWAGNLAKELPRFAYMPFGGGPRICIGNRFAMMEAVLILATVAQQFRLEWQTDRPVQPNPSITLRPGGGVWVRLVSRPIKAGGVENKSTQTSKE